jgi:hypothetical protein
MVPIVNVLIVAKKNIEVEDIEVEVLEADIHINKIIRV